MVESGDFADQANVFRFLNQYSTTCALNVLFSSGLLTASKKCFPCGIRRYGNVINSGVCLTFIVTDSAKHQLRIGHFSTTNFSQFTNLSLRMKETDWCYLAPARLHAHCCVFTVKVTDRKVNCRSSC